MSSLTNLLTYDYKKNMIFAPIKTENVPGGTMTFKRINVSTRLEDGSEGELIFKTPGKNHFCFGIKEFCNEKGEINGRSMGICIWSKDGPTEEEKTWSTKFDEMMDWVMEHIISKKVELGLPKLTKDKLEDGFSPMFWKEDNRGNRIEGQGPVLNGKVWEGKGRIRTIFHEVVGEEMKGKKIVRKTVPIIDPAKALLRQYCTVEAALTLDSLYIGGYKRPQLKLYQVVAKMNNRGPKNVLAMEDEDEDEDDVIGKHNPEQNTEEKKEDDIENSDDEEEKKPEVKPKKIVRRKKVPVTEN